MRVAVPVPAFIGVADFYEGPELQEPTPECPVDLMHVEAEPTFSQRANASDASMAVCVTGDASIPGAKRVFVKRTKRPTLDLAVEVRRDGPLSHDYL